MIGQDQSTNDLFFVTQTLKIGSNTLNGKKD